jgi:hypothetical protein
MCFILLACEASSSTSSTGGNNQSPSAAAKLPDDACKVLSAADVNAIMSPAKPFAEGKPTVAASGSTSKGCNWVSGSVATNDSIDLVVAFGFYNPNTPFPTASLEPVSGLGDDTAYFSSGGVVNKLRARKNGVVVNVQMSFFPTRESHDQGLAHTRALMEKVLAKV